jgi:hypothetical protein
MNTKKSKFQERLEAVAPKHLAEKGSINDQVKLHDDTLFTNSISEESNKRKSQPAQKPPNFLGLQHWTSVRKEKPLYYVYVNIWDGKEVFSNWVRVSDGEHDYYVNDITDEVKRDIKYWSYPAGVTHPKYEPMTAEDLPGYELTQLIKAMKKLKIHYSEMTSWTRPRAEGINDGISTCIRIVERKLKRIQKTYQLKLHKASNTGT